MERRGNYTAEHGLILKAGEILQVDGGNRIISVVGPGVVVCIWDSSHLVGTMAHFTMPAIYETSKATAMYGNVAVVQAILMAKEVAGNCLLETQVFGGAEFVSGDHRGQGNCDMAIKILTVHQLHIASKDIGGCKGRKVVFDTESGHVAVVKVHQLRDEDWHL